MNKKYEIQRYLLEFAIVVLGVFLAFFLSQRSMQRNLDLNTEITLKQIAEELEKNIELFNKAASYHNEISPHITTALEKIPENDYNLVYFTYNQFRHTEIPGWKGPGTINYQDFIYESAKISGVFKEMNIETIGIITQAYNHMEFYKKFHTYFWDYFLAINAGTRVFDMVYALSILRNDVLPIEKSISSQLNVYVGQLKAIIDKEAYKK